jgi:hypothetical protein
MAFSFMLCGDDHVMAVEEKIGAGQGCSLRPHLFYTLFGNAVVLLEGEKKTSLSLSYGRCHFLVDYLLGALAIQGI